MLVCIALTEGLLCNRTVSVGFLDMELEEGEPALELWALKELINEFQKFKTGWYSTIVAIVRRTLKYKDMKKNGRLTKMEIQGLCTAGALRMYSTELKNEQKHELLRIVKDSGKHASLAHCFPHWSTRRFLELLGSNT